jgi:soluble P-type ATPase
VACENENEESSENSGINMDSLYILYTNNSYGQLFSTFLKTLKRITLKIPIFLCSKQH